MAALLRKVWESVSSGHRRGLPSTNHDSASSLGELFDRLPADIVVQIIKMVGPQGAARLTAVSRAWRCLVSDNRIWIHFLHNHPRDPPDSIFFAELNLRFAFPLRTFPSHPSELSFMRIYGQREKAPGAVIIDGGSGYCKFGWSKYDRPSGRSATFLEFGNLETPMYTRLRHFFATIYTRSRMQVKMSPHPIILSLPICHYDDTEAAKASRHQLKETIYSVLFDMNIPAVCAINQATLALFAARRTSGIVVNIGFQVTSIVPVLHGKVMHKVGVETIGVGALKLTGFLRDRMQQNNISFESLYTVRTLKENLCYVAADYEEEMSKDTQASAEVPGEGWFILSKERFQTGEILFQPRMAGVRTMGLHQAVALCMDHCHAAEFPGDDSWYKTVVLSGGSACLPGLAERLEKELCELLSPSMCNGVKIIPPPYGADTAWYGAKFVSSLSSFQGSWCITKKQFRRKSRLNIVW